MLTVTNILKKNNDDQLCGHLDVAYFGVALENSYR